MSIESIKSIFFIRKLFSYIYEKRKLNLIIYNKNIQKIIDINLINYKIKSGKYVEHESKEFSKEYDSYNDDTLIFKGQYLNGKRNGRGEEYNSEGELIFSGEYLNGKKNGFGKEYYKNILIFEGEYLNGKKWNGKGYSKNGNILYELKDGKGFVKEYNGKNKILFIGFYKNGKKHGKGTEYFLKNKIVIFDGEYYYGKRWNGKSYTQYGNIKLELKNGKAFQQIYTKIHNDNVLVFEGGFINGERNGICKDFIHDKHLEIIGEYLNGKKHGKVKIFRNSKIIFDGEYLYGHKFRGKEYINGILEYEGEYLYDKKWDGKGYDENGNIIYELIKGKGKVKEYNNIDVLIFDGEYLNGKKNGKGKEYNDIGVLIFDGEYLNGKKYIGIYKEYKFLINLKSEIEYRNFNKIKVRNYQFIKLINEEEYINGKLNEKGFDENGNIIYQIINGNGIKKIYDKDKLLFEGEYLNGNLNGKVKKYYGNGNLLFEGTYLNGEKNGMGKEYNINGELIFEGEYLNGKRWNGKGRETNYHNQICFFEGEYLNGKRWNGNGKEYDWFNELEFEGEYVNGEKIPKKLD